jgi:hypothetical protein
MAELSGRTRECARLYHRATNRAWVKTGANDLNLYALAQSGSLPCLRGLHIHAATAGSVATRQSPLSSIILQGQSDQGTLSANDTSMSVSTVQSVATAGFTVAS